MATKTKNALCDVFFMLWTINFSFAWKVTKVVK